MNMSARQKGLTMITWIILIGLIGFVALFGFKLMPIYMDYFTINKALIDVSKNIEQGETPGQIKTSISNLFDVNSVNTLKVDDVDISTDPDTKAVTLSIDYDARTNFIANIDLIVHFSKSYSGGVASSN